MNKYIEAIKRMSDDKGVRGGVTDCIIGLLIMTLLFTFAVVTIETNGLTLLAPLLWWGYIVYKEANKDDT